MIERFPGYDVLAKRHTPSWNEQTRRVIDQRLALPREPRFLLESEWRTLFAVCGRIVPQPKNRPAVPLAAMVDDKLFENRGDGYRDYRLPPMRDAWRRGLAAIDADARQRHGVGFDGLDPAEQDALLQVAQEGQLSGHGLLQSSDRLERDRLWRAGQPARLCADEFRSARPLGGGGGQARA
jgi:gluconate 2-dehydrogenase subunit 3-like protein